jgi:tetratricopeptide (TPR) repeat protein
MKPKLTGLVVALVVIVVALSVLDRFLARVESSELHGTAQQSYLEGSKLLAAGKAAEAVEYLQEAHTVERDNAEYELALISALIDAGETSDAEPLMNEMLQREPNDGQVNLIAGRLKMKEGNAADAEAYYHRAIYGEWPEDPAQHRIEARMELIEQLMRLGRKQELIAELIALEAEPSAIPGVRKRLAKWFLMADSPARAADVYRGLIAKDAGDLEASEGLGEAELEEGQYNAARAAYLQGFFQHPNNASIKSHLEILNTVVALDPTLRQLTSEEKYRRSIRILDMAGTGLGQCAVKNPLVIAATAVVSSKPPAHITNEDAERVLTLAETVWRGRNEDCKADAGEEDALNLLMKKLTS